MTQNQVESVVQKLKNKIKEILKPSPPMSVSEWADENRVIPRGTASEPGKWRTSRVPYLKEIMDCLHTPGVWKVVGMMASQTGKTEVLINGVGFYSHLHPCPILLVQPTIGAAAKFSKKRIQPTIDATPVLKEVYSVKKSRDSGNTIDEKAFDGGYVTFVGANAPHGLASNPIKFVGMDEIDRYDESAGDEGDQIELAEKRTDTFWDRIIALISSPGIKGKSKIEPEFMAGDQRHYYVPCPHCDHKQVLLFPNLKYENNGADVHFECIDCKGKIHERHKKKMLENGEWIAHAPFNGVASFTISTLYSPWCPWTKVVNKFLTSKENPQKLKTFVNTYLAQTWEEQAEVQVDYEDLYNRRENYNLTEVPERTCILFSGTDIQKDRAETRVWGYNGRESWHIDTIITKGDPVKKELWDDLEEVLLNTEYETSTGKSLRIEGGLVDSGNWTNEVYAFIRKLNTKRFQASKGMSNLDAPLGLPKPQDINTKRGKRLRRGVMLIPVGVDILKDTFFGRLQIVKSAEAEEYPDSYVHLGRVDIEECKQLTSEKKMRVRDKKGFFKYQYVKGPERNEGLDCRILADATFYLHGCNRWKKEKWAKLEKEIWGKSKEELEEDKGTQIKKEKKKRKTFNIKT